jgi:lipopolysaccharide exporter
MKNIRSRALKLGTGTIIAQLISILSVPVITRMYGPQEYGHLTLFLSTASILIPLATLRIESRLVVTANSEIAGTMLRDAFKIAFVFCLFVNALTFIYFFTASSYNFLKCLVSSILFTLVLFAQALGIVFVQVALRVKLDGIISQSSVIQNFSTVSTQMLFGFWNPVGNLLISGFIAGRFLGHLSLLAEVKKLYEFGNKQKQNLIKLYQKQLVLNKSLISASFIDSSILGLPAILIGAKFGLEYAGYIGLSQTLLMVPITLIAGTFGSIIISELANLSTASDSSFQQNRELLSYIGKKLVVAALIFVLITGLAGPSIFLIALGSSWESASSLVSILALPFAVTLVWQPFMNVYLVQQLYGKYLRISITRIVVALTIAGLFMVLNFSWITVVAGFFYGNMMVQIKNLFDLYKQS